jgi:hypothetical protein
LSELSKAVGIEKRFMILQKTMSYCTWIVAGSQNMKTHFINGLAAKPSLTNAIQSNP